VCTGSLPKNHAAAFNAVAAFKYDADRLGVRMMLFAQDAGGERFHGVVVKNGDGALQNDWAGVEVFVDKMHGASGDFHAVVDRLVLRVETGEGGQERGVNVQDAVGELADEGGAEQPHESGQTDQIDRVLAEGIDDRTVVDFAVEPAGRQANGRKAAFACAGEAGGVGAVGDDDGDLSIERAGLNPISDSFEVGAAARDQNAKTLHRYSTRGRDRLCATTAPMRKGDSPIDRSAASARAAFFAGTQRIMPAPRLKV